MDHVIDHPFFQDIAARRVELDAFAAEYPEISAAWEEAWEEDEKRSLERAQRRMEARFITNAADELKRLGVPLRIAEALRDEGMLPVEQRRFWEGDAMRAARRYVAGDTSFLLMFGGVGAGKTCAGAWTLLCARDRNCANEIHLSPYLGHFIRAAQAARLSKFEDGAHEWNRLLRGVVTTVRCVAGTMPSKRESVC
jgi:hypothetical protein